MLKEIVSSLLGKFAVAALLVVGVIAGLAVTGAIPGLDFQPAPVAVVLEPAVDQPVGVTLDFPTQVLGDSLAEGVLPVVEIVEEVVVPAPRAPAVPAAGGLQPAIPGCIADVTASLSATSAAIPAVVTAEQGQALLDQGNALLAAAHLCVAEATQAGLGGLDTVVSLVDQVGATVAQIQALPIVSALTAPSADNPDLVGGVVEGLVGGTINRVGQGLGLLGSMLNLLGS